MGSRGRSRSVRDYSLSYNYGAFLTTVVLCYAESAGLDKGFRGITSIITRSRI